MATKTIGVREEVYERLASEKREEESFSDTIERLVESARSDWRTSFGALADHGDELEDVVEEQHEDLTSSGHERQESTLDGSG